MPIQILQMALLWSLMRHPDSWNGPAYTVATFGSKRVESLQRVLFWRSHLHSAPSWSRLKASRFRLRVTATAMIWRCWLSTSPMGAQSVIRVNSCRVLRAHLGRLMLRLCSGGVSPAVRPAALARRQIPRRLQAAVIHVQRSRTRTNRHNRCADHVQKAVFPGAEQLRASSVLQGLLHWVPLSQLLLNLALGVQHSCQL